MFTRQRALEIRRREQVRHQRVDVDAIRARQITRRVGFSWSDSSRRSSTIGSFFARICAAICSSTFAPGRLERQLVDHDLAVLDLHSARAGASVPLPVL